jgi:AcrR family transcriptional regulator
MDEKDTAKQRLINVTIEFICQGKKPSEITVADITEKAGVGNGMVNYHFQSKDNLMRTAVKRVTLCAKNSLPEKLKSLNNSSAKERLVFLLKEATNIFADNPELCKIAVLDNLADNKGPAHLLSDVEVFSQCLKELFEDRMNIIWIKNYIIASFLDYIFLKADVIKKETNFDFFDKVQRYKLVENFIDELLSCSEGCKEVTICD